MKLPQSSLRTHLLLLQMVVLVPVLLIGIVSAMLAAHKIQHYSREKLMEAAATVGEMVDERFASYERLLRLRQSLPDAMAAEAGHAALMRELSHGLVLINPADPHNLDLLPPDFLHALHSRQGTQSPVVSGVLQRQGLLPDSVAIGLPARAEHAQPLIALIPLKGLLTLHHGTISTDEGVMVTLVDNKGRIAALSRQPERWVGQLLPDWQRIHGMNSSHGSILTESLRGKDIAMGFQRLHTASGWYVLVDEYKPAYEMSWLIVISGIAAGGVIALLLSILLAGWASYWIRRPLQQLQHRSRSLLSADPNQPASPAPCSSIQEFNDLQEDLIEVQMLLKQRAELANAMAQQLRDEQSRFRAIAEVGTLVFWQADCSGSIHKLTGWQELTGQSTREALGWGWRQRVHPGDLESLNSPLVRNQTIDLEFRVRDAEESWHWVRVRGALLQSTDGLEWAGVLEDADARHMAQAHISYLAKHDVLTGLGNRSLFQEQLDTLLASGNQSGALLYMDLDRFKSVNDSFGHPQGDTLLRNVAQRLLSCLGSNTGLSRLGGDEFALLLISPQPREKAMEVGQQILAALHAPFLMNGHHLQVGISIGATLIGPDDKAADQLMQQADLALYRAKANGRERICFFAPEMALQARRRRELELDLRNALQRQEFLVHYQPIVDVISEQVAGFEALLRWQHPRLGMLAPRRFMALADEIGLMEDVGNWVLQQACRDAAAWPAPLSVAVNLAPSQLHAGLHDIITDALIDSRLPANRLELEITENAMATHIKATSQSLLALKSDGVKIVLDDFGAGRTSLSHLSAFPFDKVKIDKAFTRELPDPTRKTSIQTDGGVILSAFTHLCSSLKVCSTIEGVETTSQLQKIREYGCSQAQGYLFGRAVPAEEVLPLLAHWQKPQNAPEQPAELSSQES